MLNVEWFNDMVQGYAACLLWQATGEDSEPLDDYGTDDFTAEAVASIVQDCAGFYASALPDLTGMEAEQAGHDFCLTRNGHGAGFWDRGLGERGDRLTAVCRPYGTSDVFVGDDGKLHVS